MEPRLLFLILVGIAIGLSCLAGYWRKKAGEAAFAAALLADKAEDRDRHCRLAVMAEHRDACRMFCFAHPDFYEDRHPLKPFRFRGISVTFYGHYYPSRYKRLLDEEQRGFCRTLYAFKEGENHGIDFFKACMAALPVDDADKFQMFLLEEFDDHGDTVMFAPGEPFYATPGKGKNEIRIAYVLKQEALERAMDLLRLGIEAYNNRK